jgi:hypothetical protein
MDGLFLHFITRVLAIGDISTILPDLLGSSAILWAAGGFQERCRFPSLEWAHHVEE